MLPLVNPLSHNRRTQSRRIATAVASRPRIAFAVLAAVLGAGIAGPVVAQDAPPDARAAELVDEVLGQGGGDELGEWTRSILDRALHRAGAAARHAVPGSGSSGSRSGAGPGASGPSTAPLPAERHAAGIVGGAAGGAGTAEILVFTSLSVPAASWRQWAREAANTGAPLVLRGVGEGGMRETVKKIGERLGGAEAGVAIDPRLFRLFGVTRVPAVAVVPGGVPPCRSRGCTADAAPPHDLVMGNIGLAAALEAIADEGAVGRDIAHRHLERLGRGQP